MYHPGDHGFFRLVVSCGRVGPLWTFDWGCPKDDITLGKRSRPCLTTIRNADTRLVAYSPKLINSIAEKLHGLLVQAAGSRNLRFIGIPDFKHRGETRAIAAAFFV